MNFRWKTRLRRPAAEAFRSLCVLTALAPSASAIRAAAPVPADHVVGSVIGSVDVAPVWAGHPVGFALLTLPDRQYVAFYAVDRHLTVASRALGSDTWEFFRLPSERAQPPRGPNQTSAVIGWDSHNSIVMAVDTAGQIHLVGNMHDNGLTYWRTRRAGAIDSFEQVKAMVGRDEDRCTYPVFLTLPDGRLVFQYRVGRSGDGSTIMNVYDVESRSWRRLVDQPIFDGEGKRNAYPLTPVLGPDDRYHVSWVWRESPDAAANHDLSYARTRDFALWEDAAGRPLGLPIRLATEGVVVDPVPVGGGIINGAGRVGFDSRKRPVISYYKYDAAGHSQAFVARSEGETWQVAKLTDWDHRFELTGPGTLPRYDIHLGAVRPGNAGELLLEFGHVKQGSGVWVLDEETLAVLRTEPVKPHYPRSLWKVESSFPEMRVRYADDLGASGEPGRRFILRWETLGANRDKPRPEPWPEPSMLRVV
ncbi:MAG: BNR repeat-containing protein, partial [Planctomycetia bacterium]